MFRYYSYLEDWPSKDGYRFSHMTKNLGVSLICPWVILTGDSGKTYQFMRGYGVNHPTEVLTFGGYVGNGELDRQGDLLYTFKELPAVERFQVSETDTAITYASQHHRLTLGQSGYAWVDADGRIDLKVDPLGQPMTYWIPQQEGMPHPTLSRSHLGWVTGTIDNDPVTGLWTHDHMYSTPGLTFMESEFIRRVHNFWMNWLVEYEDGTIEGGTAWTGRPGTGFTAAHHYVDGQSHARSDAHITVEWTERGSVDTLNLTLGEDLAVEFDQHGSFDWPIHSYGTAKTISRDKPIKRSWNYSEHFPLNFGLIEDLQRDFAAAHGRYPSLQGLMEGARVESGNVVLSR